MAGDHTTQVACDLLPSVTLRYDEHLLSLYAFSLYYITLSPYPCPQSAFSPTMLFTVAKLSHIQTLYLPSL